MKCYHIEAWLTFEEYHEAHGIIDRNVAVIPVVDDAHIQLTRNVIAAKMKELSENSEYNGLTWHELHTIAVGKLKHNNGSGFYKGDTEITEDEINNKMKFLNDTGEYDGFSYNELRKIAIEVLQQPS